MNSPCFEQTRLSWEATAAQETREATEAPSSQVISLNKLPSKSDNLERPLQPKRNSSRPLQPKHSLTCTASIKRMKILITSRPLQPHFIREKKAIQVNKTKTKFELVTIDKTKMIQFIFFRCHRTAPLCINWYWHSETLRLDAPAKRHVCKKKSMQTNKTN